MSQFLNLIYIIQSGFQFSSRLSKSDKKLDWTGYNPDFFIYNLDDELCPDRSTSLVRVVTYIT